MQNKLWVDLESRQQELWLGVVEAPRGAAAQALLQVGLGWSVTCAPLCVHPRAQQVPGGRWVPLGSGATLGTKEPEEQWEPRESQASR